MTRRRWTLVILSLTALLGAYVVYDWTRPCIGGPVKQTVLAIAGGGSFTVRCAG